jgi:hypothetical protein
MERFHAYPPDLARYVQERWPSGQELWPSLDLLTKVLAVAYEASLTTEEGRPTHFRILLTPAAKLPESGAPNDGVLRLSFEPTRPFTADELRRLSPSVPFEAALIGVHQEEEKLRIWGIAHSGSAWLAPSWGGRQVVPNWTYDPIVHVTAPGRVAVRCAGHLIAALERGQLENATTDVFESTWLRELFYRESNSVRDVHAALQAQTEAPTQAEHQLIGRLAQQMLRRAIRLIRGAQHGGLILLLDADQSPTESGELPGLRLKYRFKSDEPARRYRSLQLEILQDLATRSDKSSIDWQDFVADTSPQLARLEQAVLELSRLMANLTAIDGALVLDKRFALVGYGAEVSAELPAPTEVWHATDAEGDAMERKDIENVGTRHRAAYRFVHGHPERLAVVVSQDGGVSFVASRGNRVVYWEQSVSP